MKNKQKADRIKHENREAIGAAHRCLTEGRIAGYINTLERFRKGQLSRESALAVATRSAYVDLVNPEDAKKLIRPFAER